MTSKLTYSCGVATLGLLTLFGQWLCSDGTLPGPQYHTAVGERRRITLADGSILELNTNTTLEVDSSARVRRVRLLTGEVYCHVAPGPLPFEIYSGALKIQDRATEFDVYRKADRTTVAVAEGRVAVLDSSDRHAPLALGSPSASAKLVHLQVVGASLQLDAGGQVQVSDTLGVSAKDLSASDLARQVAWRDGRIDFFGASLAEAIAEVKRYNNVEFVIADASLEQDPFSEQIRLGGVIPTNDVEQFIELLQSVGIIGSSVDGPRGVRVVTLRRAADKHSRALKLNSLDKHPVTAVGSVGIGR